MLKAIISKGLLTYRWTVNGSGIYDDDRIIGDPLYDADGKIEEFVWVDFDVNDVLSVNQARKDLILAERAQAEADRIKIETDKETVKNKLNAVLGTLTSNKVDNDVLATAIKQIVTILLDKKPRPDVLRDTIIPNQGPPL